jgi:hypothetical protein
MIIILLNNSLHSLSQSSSTRHYDKKKVEKLFLWKIMYEIKFFSFFCHLKISQKINFFRQTIWGMAKYFVNELMRLDSIKCLVEKVFWNSLTINSNVERRDITQIKDRICGSVLFSELILSLFASYSTSLCGINSSV